jgi:prophage tail gpP-like protein
MNLKINDRIKVRNIAFFNNFSMELRYDAVASTFRFGFYFDETNPDHKELACVSHFHEAIVEHNGERLVTGYILSEAFSQSPTYDLTTFGGYSKAGVLEDCPIPVEAYPLQSDGLSLREIAQKYLAPFNVKMLVSPSVAAKMDVKYETTTAKESQSVKSYLTELAAQRNIVISHDEYGSILFTQANTKGNPVAHFEDGIAGVNMALSFNGQGIHSHITVVKQADSDGGNAGEYTIVNPYCPIVYRPTVVVQNSGDDVSSEDAARNALASELKNIVLKITMDRWDIDGKLVRPNRMVSVLSPRLFLYKRTSWFVESVAYEGNPESLSATLTCVRPEVYNGEYPVNIFVDPHRNSP